MKTGRPKSSKEGYVYFVNNRERWVCEYNIFDKEKGKKVIKKKSFLTKNEADEFLTNLQYQKGNELFIKNNGIPLGQLMRSNLQRKLDMNLISEVQYTRVLKTIATIEKNSITNRYIDDLKSEEIQTYLNSIKDYSNSYIKKIVEQFNQAYRLAINKGYISKNPMNDVIKPKSTKADKIVRALTIEEQQALTDYFLNKTIKEEPYKNAYLMQMYLGLRIGEALALRYSDIDLTHNLIRVTKTLTVDSLGKPVMGDSTKTYAGIREVPIPTFIKESVIEQMKIAKNNKDEQLFLSSSGKYIDGRNANERLKDRAKKLGITGISTHSLRHTFGTRCVEAGMRAVALQRLMGHKDVSVTLNTYTSVFNKYKESELEKVNDYYLSNAIFNTSQLENENKQLLDSLEEIKDDEEEEI